jgi:hypothetical protein
MFIFSRGRGTVSVMPDGREAIPFRISLHGQTFAKAIITQAAIVQNDNYQFLHTLADTIYVYVFGTRIGELVVGGFAFANTCWAGPDGLNEILATYNYGRIAVRPAPVVVVIGHTAFAAFLTGMQAQIVDPENMLTQWSYRFATFPEGRQ